MYAERAYFFDRGLAFECQRCGACCTGAPGTIYVAPDEVADIADYLRLSPGDFIRRYLYPYKNSYSIREDASGNCLFFNQGCTIYRIRPVQCRAFPFWFANVRSPLQWQRLKRQCPGIGKGKHYSREQIIALAQQTMMI